MNKNTSFARCIPSICLVISLIILTGCTSENKPKEIRLIKDLEIGEESGDERFVFSRIPSIALDSNENIYILDRMNLRINKFDENGNFLDSLKIGKGQGPGEVSIIYSMAVTPNGKIFLFDRSMRKVVVFDGSGEFSNSFIVEFYASFILPSLSENVIILGLNKDQVFHVFSESGELLASFGYPFKIPQKYAQYGELPQLQIPLRADISQKGRLFLVNPHKYEIKIFENKQLKYTLEHSSEEFTPLQLNFKDKESGAIGMVFPLVTVLENKDRLYVTLRKSVEDTTYTMHVFENSKFITSLQVNGYAYAIDRKGRLYFSEETDYPKMVRYSVSEE